MNARVDTVFFLKLIRKNIFAREENKVISTRLNSLKEVISIDFFFCRKRFLQGRFGWTFDVPKSWKFGQAQIPLWYCFLWHHKLRIGKICSACIQLKNDYFSFRDIRVYILEYPFTGIGLFLTCFHDCFFTLSEYIRLRIGILPCQNKKNHH